MANPDTRIRLLDLAIRTCQPNEGADSIVERAKKYAEFVAGKGENDGTQS